MDEIADDSTPDIAIETQPQAEGGYVIVIRGEVDIVGADPLRRAIADAVAAAPRRLVFDLGGVRFIDSAGLAALIEAATKVEKVSLRSPSVAVRRAIELTGLASVLPIEP